MALFHTSLCDTPQLNELAEQEEFRELIISAIVHALFGIYEFLL